MDELGNIYLYDDVNARLIKYSDQGRIFEEFKMPLRCFGIAVFGKKILMNMVRDARNRIVYNSSLYDLETKNNIEKDLGRPGYDDYLNPSFSLSEAFRSNKSVLFYKRFSKEIYRTEGSSIEQVINLETDDLPPLEFVESNRDVLQLTADTKYIKDITDLYENDDFFVFRMHKDPSTTICVVSKQSGKVHFFKSSFNNDDFLGAYSFYGTHNQQFFSIVPSMQIASPNFKELVDDASMEASEKQKLFSMNAGSNPAIVVFDINPDLK